MSDVICASGLMRTEFRHVTTEQTLGEAMAVLREAQHVADLPNALMVVDSQGQFVSMLTAKLLIRILVGSNDPSGDVDDVQLLRVAQERLQASVGDALILDIPVVAPDDRLLTMIRRGVGTRLDFVPVVDDGRPVGLVPITAIFQAAASIALTPEHEGIRFDR